MAKITSKSGLTEGVNIIIDEGAKTIQLLAAGGLVFKDGVTMQAVYSFCVDAWATAAKQDSPFPFYALDNLSGQYQIGTDGASFNGWTFSDTATRTAIRDAGWSEFNAAGVETAQYVGAVGLGSITPATTCQPYYHLAETDAAINFPFTDQFNVGVKVKDNVGLDKKTYFKAYIREYGKKFKSSTLADTGSSGTGPFKQNFLVANEDDLKITGLLGSVAATADAAMSGAPYNGITVAYYSANQTRSIGGSNYNFKIIIEGNGGTLEQIYAKVQYLLRQNSDINVGGTAGTKTGKIQSDLLSFVGDTLVTSQSVFIDDVLSADSNRVEFYDDSNTKRVNPYTAAGTMTFNAPLVGAGSSYRLMYAAGPGASDDFGESGAITVLDASDNPITGTISSGSISFTFDYDGDSAGGTAGTDKNVVLIGIKPGTGKYVSATGTLTRSKAIALSLVAEVDRVYSPA